MVTAVTMVPVRVTPP